MSNENDEWFIRIEAPASQWATIREMAKEEDCEDLLEKSEPIEGAAPTVNLPIDIHGTKEILEVAIMGIVATSRGLDVANKALKFVERLIGLLRSGVTVRDAKTGKTVTADHVQQKRRKKPVKKEE